MKVSFLFVVLCFFFVSRGQTKKLNINSREMVDYINSLNTTWKAAISKRFEGLTEDYFRGLCGSKSGGPRLPVKREVALLNNEGIPDEFDARKQWPHCLSIGNIRDQGSCGACWAMGAAEAISDRLCIASNGSIQVNISAEEVLSCVSNYSHGCLGGFAPSTWQYWKEEGLVTGGQYGSAQGCQPYTIPPCNHYDVNCTNTVQSVTPACKKSCQPGYKVNFEKDKYYGKSAYFIEDGVEAIQREIMTHGPVESSFAVYSDFINYKSGVYKCTSNHPVGGHAIKIIGWGTELGTPYWLVANSWNTHWGENGYFKIIRGINECKIETDVMGGEPLL